MPILDNDKIKNLVPYLYISLGLLVVFFILGRFNPQRVGDGGEYYALYYAWDTTFRPWMTSIAYSEYEKLYASHGINSLVSREWLENAFQALKIRETADYNHFWFYSFLAFFCTKILSLLGVNLQIHESFLVLHYLLLLTVTSISYRYYKWNGVFVLLLMTFISPMLWFLDKVHTELFTYCLVLSSIILISAKKYLPAALFLALASTQNPSFALIACIPVIYRLVLQRNAPYNIVDVVVCVATVLAVLAHPVYYFARFGVVTPQLLAGGASLGGNLSSFYIWIIDPDLGLLPNWSLGSAALVLGLCIWLSSKDRHPANFDRGLLIFLILYFFINLYAHSSTTNLNTGATPGLARYALWYLPLAFPIIYRIFVSFTWGRTGFYFLIPTILFISVLSVKRNDPRKPENYSRPSLTSYFIQSKLPWLYNPPPEVFLERYSGFGEGVYSQNIRGVIGPDCRKLLLLSGDNRERVIAPEDCSFDPVKLDLYAKHLSSKINDFKYVSLNVTEVLNFQAVSH